MKKVVHYADGSDNIHNLAHYDLECLQCGCRFNLWDCPTSKIKETYGDNWKQYA